MNNTDKSVSYTNTCIKCDKSMISEDGSRIGGMMNCVSLRGEIIFSTTCWECSLSEDN